MSRVLRFVNPKVAPTLLITCLFISASVASAASSGSAQARRALDKVLPQLKLDGVPLGDAMSFIQDVSGANVHINWRALESAGVGKDVTVNVRVRSVTLRKALSMVLSESGNGLLTFYIDDGVIEVTTKELADKVMVTRIYPVEDLIMEVPDFTDAPTINLNNIGNNGGGVGGGGGFGGSGGGFGGGGGYGGGGGGGGGVFGNTSSGNSNNSNSGSGMTREQRAQQLIDLITTIIRPEIWQVNGGTAGIRFYNGSLVVTAPRSVHEALDGPVD